MKLFSITTNDRRFLVIASDIREAECMAIDEYYRAVLDDDLADLMDTKFVANVPGETRPRIFAELEMGQIPFPLIWRMKN